MRWTLSVDQAQQIKKDFFRRYSEMCNSPPLSAQHKRSLRQVFNDDEDIDLFAGGSLEDPNLDGLVGQTFMCIIGEQFLRLKQGDQFYYEHGHNPKTRFSLPQLRELRKVFL